MKKIVLDWDNSLHVRQNSRQRVVASIHKSCDRFFPIIHIIELCDDEYPELVELYNEEFINACFSTMEDAKKFADRWLEKIGCIFLPKKLKVMM